MFGNSAVVPSDLLKRWAEYQDSNSSQTVDKKILGALVGEFEQVLDAHERRLVWGWLFRQPGEAVHGKHSKTLTACQVGFLRAWVGAVKVGDSWLPRVNFADELKWALWEAEETRSLELAGLADGGMAQVALMSFKLPN